MEKFYFELADCRIVYTQIFYNWSSLDEIETPNLAQVLRKPVKVAIQDNVWDNNNIFGWTFVIIPQLSLYDVQYNTNNYHHTDPSAVADGDICSITSVHYIYYSYSSIYGIKATQ